MKLDGASDHCERIEILRTLCEKDLIAYVSKNTWGVDLRGPSTYLLGGHGKRIRPILTLLAYKLSGGRDLDTVLPVARAIELIHHATLIHDDLLDQSKTRRGIPSTHSEYGVPYALLAGDNLFQLAYRSILETEASRLRKNKILKVLRTVSRSCSQALAGQAEDLVPISVNAISELGYYRIAEKKTGALFSGAVEAGAQMASANDKILHSLAQFGKRLGIAYQIKNDLADIDLRDRKLATKHFEDLSAGRQTLYLVYALRSASMESRKQISSLLAKRESLSRDAMLKLVKSFDELGAIELARNKARIWAGGALKTLHIFPSSPWKTTLKGLVTTVVE